MNARVELNTHPIMTLEQAKECGLTASQVRTIARSLERRANYNTSGNPDVKNAIGPFSHEFRDYRPNFDPLTNRRNAARLRALARQM